MISRVINKKVGLCQDKSILKHGEVFSVTSEGGLVYWLSCLSLKLFNYLG